MRSKIRQRAEMAEIFAEAVHGYARSHGVGVAGQAAMIGREIYGHERSADWLYKMMDGTRPVQLAVWFCVQKYSGDDAMVQFLARESGGSFVRLPPEGQVDEVTICRAVMDTNKAMSTYAEALADGRIEPHEMVACQRDTMPAIEALLGLQRHCARKLEEEVARPKNLRAMQAPPKERM
jgi:hypothetical protein